MHEDIELNLAELYRRIRGQIDHEDVIVKSARKRADAKRHGHSEP